ncbi:SoxR reducing system RseC family protein [Marinobacter psychrophilus]|jgi:sigma-E factor negative regulatory protein RseC|uniref:SoxR reducing system RseC family protein n=1 Tax=Marinobacter psychrophilus TaxID=330734 RepID=UPI001B713BB3|nr:SoxR reducing system RseC family protein [Marinobacter psychrophilus]MBQ0763380.1 SoxR reducing system RseC family protein [Marinobacter psychrophilus]MBQ0845561.1 SoxR reducing system RseC family protein [Marinobacter psychrophilus]
MITESGRVVAVSGNTVWVQTIRQSACQSCSARSGCGQRVLAAASGGRANQVQVLNTLHAGVGDDVTLGIAEQALLQASLLVYALPLLLMVAASIAANQLVPGSDGVAILAAGLGLGAGFFVARRWQRHMPGDYQPHLMKVNKHAPAQAL